MKCNMYMIILKIGSIFGIGSPLISPRQLAAFRIDKPTIARGKNFTTVSLGDMI